MKKPKADYDKNKYNIVEQTFLIKKEKLLRTTYLILKNKEDAQDAVQETYCLALENIKNFEKKDIVYSSDTMYETNFIPIEEQPHKILVLSYLEKKLLETLNFSVNNLEKDSIIEKDLKTGDLKITKIDKNKIKIAQSTNNSEYFKLFCDNVEIASKGKNLDISDRNEAIDIEGEFILINSNENYKLEIWGYEEKMVDIKIPLQK
ncbi:hypothetical protein RBH29_12885 [Herbivorax sp. ANBcel31]|uniref:hypothetical protein n=1 Tax=Herbivorax sp. ANBcel31 TaxID=3069754 RepID=UPI0027B631F1|nr:hypothetical protein [Herbivorax sp. ANBcel31]MDQ2087321.1 hypothetical protein [Herbivorax sp. ANBcel31]